MRPFANGQGSFDLATANIKRLMAKRRSVTVRCTLSNQCLDRASDGGIPRGLRFQSCGDEPLLRHGRPPGPYDLGPEENAILGSRMDYFMDRLLEQLARGERIRFNPWAAAVRNIHDRQNRRMRCGVGRGCTTVGIDGKLYPCHRYVGMAPYVLGHVATGIDQPKFISYLQGYFATKAKCDQCWGINICGGYCPWYVSAAMAASNRPRMGGVRRCWAGMSRPSGCTTRCARATPATSASWWARTGRPSPSCAEGWPCAKGAEPGRKGGSYHQTAWHRAGWGALKKPPQPAWSTKRRTCHER